MRRCRGSLRPRPGHSPSRPCHGVQTPALPGSAQMLWKRRFPTAGAAGSRCRRCPGLQESWRDPRPRGHAGTGAAVRCAASRHVGGTHLSSPRPPRQTCKEFQLFPTGRGC